MASSRAPNRGARRIQHRDSWRRCRRERFANLPQHLQQDEWVTCDFEYNRMLSNSQKVLLSVLSVWLCDFFFYDS